MSKCDHCGLSPELIERYCRFVYGKRQCYKKDVLPKFRSVTKGRRTTSEGVDITVMDDKIIFHGRG